MIRETGPEIPYSFDSVAFSEAVRAARGNRTLRAVEDLIRERFGVAGAISTSTLNRIENGQAPDMPTFLRLCAWIGMPPAAYFASGAWEAMVSRVECLERRLAALERPR